MKIVPDGHKCAGERIRTFGGGSLQWCARVADNEEFGSGFGKTKQAAIADLLEKLKE